MPEEAQYKDKQELSYRGKVLYFTFSMLQVC